jgi:hypothetical protein
LINLLSFKDNEEVQCHAISTLRNLAASSEKNKTAIVKAGAVQSIKELVLEVPMNVQSEMTACVAVLALSGSFDIHGLPMIGQFIPFYSFRWVKRPFTGDGYLWSVDPAYQLAKLGSARE